jgi:dienelactone hydrolase
MVKVDQHDAYLASASGPVAHEKAGILYIPDILGIWQNSQLLADEFAAAGYTTLVIDLFNGDQMLPNEVTSDKVLKWTEHGHDGKSPHTTQEIDPIVQRALAYMRGEMGFERIGAVGYCFGGKYVARHGINGIDAGFIGHPSFVTDEELTSFKRPLSIAAAEVDVIFPAELRHKSEKLLEESGIAYQINLYSGVAHGFAVRCDLSKKLTRWRKEQAFRQALEWFDFWLDEK